MSGESGMLQQAREAVERRGQRTVIALQSVDHEGEGPEGPSLGYRVANLERSFADLRTRLDDLAVVVARMDTKLDYLATRDALEKLRGEVMTSLAGKPGLGAMWAMGITLFALVVAAMSAGAAYLPFLTRSLHGSP